MFDRTRLTAAREAAGISIADRAGLSISTVYGYETGRRTPQADQLAELAKALGCSSDYLLGLVSEREDAILQRVTQEIRAAFGTSGHV